MSDFAKYEALRESGSSPKEVYAAAKRDGIDAITLIRMVRVVFGLDLVQAKEVAVEVDAGETLDAHQGKLVPGVEGAIGEKYKV